MNCIEGAELSRHGCAARSRTAVSISTRSSEATSDRIVARRTATSLSLSLTRRRKRSSVRRHLVRIRALETPCSICRHSGRASGWRRARRSSTEASAYAITCALAASREGGQPVDLESQCLRQPHPVGRRQARRRLSYAQRHRSPTARSAPRVFRGQTRRSSPPGGPRGDVRSAAPSFADTHAPHGHIVTRNSHNGNPECRGYFRAGNTLSSAQSSTTLSLAL